MTDEQIKAKSAEKVKAITTLCNQLQIVISSEQVITDKGFIKQVVYYTDNEKYAQDKPPVDRPPVTKRPNELQKPPSPKVPEPEKATPEVL